jgi:hypothetical protein
VLRQYPAKRRKGLINSHSFQTYWTQLEATRAASIGQFVGGGQYPPTRFHARLSRFCPFSAERVKPSYLADGETAVPQDGSVTVSVHGAKSLARNRHYPQLWRLAA